LLGLALAVTAFGQEDVLKLKSGARFEGRIVAETETTVTLQFPGGTMELRRDLIAEIVRGAPGTGPAGQDPTPILAALTRFQERDEWYFLYQSGRRVGWRLVETRREIRRGVAGYVRRDRLVFTAPAGGPPDVDLLLVEFVDAELKPVEAHQRLSAGGVTRVVEGIRDGESFVLTERTGGRATERKTLFGAAVELPAFLLKRLAAAPVPEGGYGTFQVFDPREVDFGEVKLSRSIERVSLHGSLLDVMIFRRKLASGVAETWFDLAGRVVREEIGSRSLVAVVTDQKRVEAFASGDAKSGADDLGLVVSCDEAGLRLDRPDVTWEVLPGVAEKQLLTALVKASSRATVEVFEVRPRNGAVSAESAALHVLAKLQDNCEGFSLDGPVAQTIGDSEGLRFTVDCRRRSAAVKTLGFIVPHAGRIFVVLCAAPAEKYADVHASFLRILQSLRIERQAPSRAPVDPHAEVEREISVGGA
jgi:hypothetical protein